ncbi:hypothetical protein ACJX0J_034189 [Zea mays]
MTVLLLDFYNKKKENDSGVSNLNYDDRKRLEEWLDTFHIVRNNFSTFLLQVVVAGHMYGVLIASLDWCLKEKIGNAALLSSAVAAGLGLVEAILSFPNKMILFHILESFT